MRGQAVQRYSDASEDVPKYICWPLAVQWHCHTHLPTQPWINEIIKIESMVTHC